MPNTSLQMNNVRAQAPILCEYFDRSGFEAILTRLGLSDAIDCIDCYEESGWIVPISSSSNSKRYHCGCILILLRLKACSTLSYHAGLNGCFDFEDILCRRAMCSEIDAQTARDDAKHINSLFLWLNGDNADAFSMLDAVHTKAVIDLTLDSLDPQGFYESLQYNDDNSADSTYLLVRKLIKIQTEIGMLVAQSGKSVPNVKYIYDRKLSFDKIRKFLVPAKSPFLATPKRDMMADERMDFMRKRNELLIGEHYQDLVDLYLGHMDLFDSDIALQAELNVCLGHIYGDLLNDSAKAAAAFQEALDYNPGNSDAFDQVSHHLREAQKWSELVDLLSNHWDSIEDAQKRCALILEAAQIQAFKCQNIHESIGLYERCMTEGYPGCDFDNLYKIIVGLMDDFTDLEKMRALVILSMHLVNFSQRDKINALKEKFDKSDDPLGRCLSLLIDAGNESFGGDQPHALELMLDAIVQSPNSNIFEGVLHHIASKIRNIGELKEQLDNLESEDLSSETLSSIWFRIARVLAKLPPYRTVALGYAEKSVSANSANADAIALCFKLADKLGMQDRAFAYATILALRTSDAKKQSELENTCNELKLAIGDDYEKLMSAYDVLLQFNDVQNDIQDGLRDLIQSIDTDKAVNCVQRIEAKCIAAGQAELISDLYQSVLERDISNDLRKNLLERYIGILLGQGAATDLDRFISAHAQLYALAPADRLYAMAKSVTKDDAALMKSWAGNLEDAVSNIDDSIRVAKIQSTLADCYQNVIKDPDKAAEVFANQLNAAPESISAFKNCFDCFASLERWFDCVEITKAFPLVKLQIPDSITYVEKAFQCALINVFDIDAAKKFFDVIVKAEPARITDILIRILDAATPETIDPDQFSVGLEQIEHECTGSVAVLLQLARAQKLAQINRPDDAAAILGQPARDAVTQFNLSIQAQPFIDAVKKTSAWDLIKDLWTLSKSKSSILPPPGHPARSASNPAVKAPSAAKLADLIQKCTEHPDSDEFTSDINDALKSVSPDQAASACIQLGNLYENAGRFPAAETYFKLAFAHNQSFELLEFYRRCRLFKKALKILRFKLDKSPEDEKNNIRLDLALTYEQLQNYPAALDMLDAILQSNRPVEPAAHIAVLKQKAAYLIAVGNPQLAIETLKTASAMADSKAASEIDIDTCLLMRMVSPEDAKRLHQSLQLRGTKSDKMTLLTLCFDIDAQKFAEADKKIEALLKSPIAALREPVLEARLRLLQTRGDAHDEIIHAANALLAVSPDNPKAKEALNT